MQGSYLRGSGFGDSGIWGFRLQSRSRPGCKGFRVRRILEVEGLGLGGFMGAGPSYFKRFRVRDFRIPSISEKFAGTCESREHQRHTNNTR